jgi:F0F1-type ATP synthase assembly protein I
VAFFGFICYFLVRNSNKLNKKIIYITFSILLAIAICFSRIYLGVHYLSDVMAGFLLGLFSLFIAIGISERFFIKENEKKISYNFKNYYIFYILFLISVLSFTLIFEHEISPLKISPTNTIDINSNI